MRARASGRVAKRLRLAQQSVRKYKFSLHFGMLSAIIYMITI